VADPIGEGLLASDWPGLELGVKLPTFVREGAVKLGAPESPQVRPPILDDDGSFVHSPDDEFNLTDFGTAKGYRVTLPEGIEAVAELRAQRLAAAAAPPPASDPVSKAVFGSDDRVPMGGAQGYGRESWLSAIGLVGAVDRTGGACTGTLIAPNAFITAAHCLYNDAGDPVPRYIMPRFDPAAGTVQQQAPWGLHRSNKMFTPAAWEQNNCHKGRYRRECEQHDIAFVLVTQAANAPANPYYFRFAAETRDQLLQRALRNVGYPECGKDESPSNCMGGQLYGSRASCALGRDAYPDVQYSPVVHHDCDSNAGHSGGPLFYYVSQGQPVLVGVHVATDDLMDAAHPNVMKRFSQNTLNWINGLL
jgi:Trypsin